MPAPPRPTELTVPRLPVLVTRRRVEVNEIPDRAESPEFDQLSGRDDLRSYDVWAHSAPIRLAGYEDDLAEPHILPGID
ncbi:hypothetical protein [Streptomyces boninensis]|uniref:hypothetical protein n=1 Tax=Streptomyces boninensis TaxID=2039455 RepID=UPI003B223B43